MTKTTSTRLRTVRFGLATLAFASAVVTFGTRPVSASAYLTCPGIGCPGGWTPCGSFKVGDTPVICWGHGPHEPKE